MLKRVSAATVLSKGAPAARWLVMLCLGAGLLAPQAASAQVQSCPKTSMEELESLIEDTEAKIALVEYGDALSQLESLESRMPCAPAQLSTETLARMYVYRGVTFFFLNNDEGAVREFAAALTIEPDLQWDENLGDRPRDRFEDARTRIEATPAEYVAPVYLAPGVKVTVDGRVLFAGEQMPLLPGTHLLQYANPKGVWSGRYFTVHPGVSPVLPIPTELTVPAVRPTEPEPGGDGDGGQPSPVEPREATAVWRTATWGGAAVTAGGFITLTVAGTQFLASRNYLKNEFYSDETDPDRIEARDAELLRNAKLARIANTGLGITVVGAAVTGLSVWMDSRQPTSSAMRLTPWLEPGGGGVILSAAF